MAYDISGKNVPKVLPLRPAQPDGSVMFPGIPVRFTSAQESIEATLREPYRIIAMFVDGIPLLNVAIIGEIILHEAGKERQLYIKGIARVFFRIVQKDAFGLLAEWLLADEINDLPSEKRIQSELRIFKENIRAYIQSIKASSRPEVQGFLTNPFVEPAIKQIAGANRETISQAIDNAMCIVSHTLPSSSDDVQLQFFMRAILEERSGGLRLFLVRSFFEKVLNREEMASDERAIALTDGSEPSEESISKRGISGRSAIIDSLQPRSLPLLPHSSRSDQREPESKLRRLDHKRASPFMANTLAFFDRYLVNQDRAKRQFIEALMLMKYRSRSAQGPVIGGMFLGPTGVGKTELIKVGSRFLFDDARGYTHIDCGILQEGHEKSFLVSAPPGYVGYNQTQIISQWRIDRAHVLSRLRKIRGTDFASVYHELKKLEIALSEVDSQHQSAIYTKIQRLTGWIPGENISIILFDEIERAHPNIWETIMRVLDDGYFQLLSGEVVVCKNSIFCFTSNLYGSELMQEISGTGRIGIRPEATGESLEERFKTTIYNEVLNAVKNYFKSNPAFLGRIGKENMVVCYPLEEANYRTVLELRIDECRSELTLDYRLGGFIVSDGAKQFFIREALDPLNRALGVRAFNRVFERITKAVSILLDQEDGPNKLIVGDWVYVDTATNENGEEKFVIEQRRPPT